MHKLKSKQGLQAFRPDAIDFIRLSWTIIFCLNCSLSLAANNQPPIAETANDQRVKLAETVILDGSNSRDLDGQITKYRWQQTKGQKVKLLDAQTPIARFVSPENIPSKVSARTLIFKLTVTDNRKKSASDNLTITLSDCRSPRFLSNGECIDPTPVCKAPQTLQDSRCITPSKPLSCNPPLIARDGACRLPLAICALPQILQNGICALPVTHEKINDTGITSCSDTEHNGKPCPLEAYPGQDAEFGRDLYFNDDSDGHAGLSYKKMAADGTILPSEANEWSCIEDQVTGLIWEVKRAEDDLHNPDTLFNYNEIIDYVNRVNVAGWCGAHNWRLPTADELQMIVDYGVLFPGPAIDQRFFPNTPNLPHWTNTPHAQAIEKAWIVAFDDGRVFDDVRSQRYSVRLVREKVK